MKEDKKLLDTANNTCWCEFCGKKIEKGEKFLFILKSAWKGSVRINICRDCLIRMVAEVGVSSKELNKIKKELIVKQL